jgi:hypothetical protein
MPPAVPSPELDVSLVVAAFNMERELPRTLLSLSPPLQRGCDDLGYEIVVMDNGSRRRLESSDIPEPSRPFVRYHHVADAGVSPVKAINRGLALARGRLVGVMIDGARLASPGLVKQATVAGRLHPRPVIATLGFHLGPGKQELSVRRGYDQAAEDRLLAASGWERDGYNLFSIASLAGSSSQGWFRPLSESNALFMTKALWDELGGLDERFRLPGGGTVNLDTYVRACALPDSQLIVLLGEGTFHQVHGGVATNATDSGIVRRFFEEYEAIRGRPFEAPRRTPVYFGSMPWQSLPFVATSVAHALRDWPGPRRGPWWRELPAALRARASTLVADSRRVRRRLARALRRS